MRVCTPAGGYPLSGRRLGEAPDLPGVWIPSQYLAPEEIVGSVGREMRFALDFLYGCHERWSLTDSVRLTHACARASLLCANGAIDGAKRYG